MITIFNIATALKNILKCVRDFQVSDQDSKPIE